MNFDFLLDNITLAGPQFGVGRGFKRRELVRLLRVIQLRRRTEGDETIGAAVEARVRAQLRKLKSPQH